MLASIDRYNAPRTRYDPTITKLLDNKGISAFFDDWFHRKAEEISPSLIKAIGESEISIIIFSENYASSARCLEELVEILECRKSFGRLVWPVFLGVKPSEVINQTGNFEKALAEYEGSSDRKKEKLAKWKDALTQASSLSGWHLGDGYEPQLIQRIVEAAEAALRKINRRVPLHVAKYPVGIEDRFLESKPLIDVGTGKNDVKFIGIYGIGGVGKTTIAKALFNKFADEFEGSSFLANVRETSKQNLGFVQLQGKLLFDMLGDKNLKVGNVHRGINIIRQRLCFKRVLVVLDDVDELDQLETLAGGHEWFGLGSRIIITTRNKHLLTTHGADGIYEARVLDHYRAVELFSWNAFKRDKPSEDYLTLSEQHIIFWVPKKRHILLYENKIFPNWRGLGSFSCLVEVDLGYCKSCYSLPSLGQLPFLKKFHIQGFGRVERIDEEFYSTTDSLSSSKPFKSLESLTFSHMLRWKEWSVMRSRVFSDLKQLTEAGRDVLPQLSSILAVTFNLGMQKTSGGFTLN
nr:disease resistance protein RPV1-like [Ziziphus jujuba var. spinosa]